MAVVHHSPESESKLGSVEEEERKRMPRILDGAVMLEREGYTLGEGDLIGG